MITLRDYQDKNVTAIREAFADGHRRVLYVAPTGAGKTTVFSYIAAGATNLGNRVDIHVHRQELIKQVTERLGMYDIPYGVIAPGRYRTSDLVQVCSIFTMKNRIDSHDDPVLSIYDEAHHFAASTWQAVANARPDARILGVTATPCRADGKGLKEYFDYVVHGPSIRELITAEWLVKPIVYAPPTKLDMTGVRSSKGDYVKKDIEERVDKSQITGDAIEHYKRICNDIPGVIFCVSVAHAEHVAKQFSDAGIPTKSIDGKMSTWQRATILNELATGAIKLVASCDLISEGFDLPKIGCAILLRPTKSLALFLQQVGRALRSDSGKRYAYILDHVGNCLIHGLPDDNRAWSLEGVEKKSREASDPAESVVQCPNCYAAFHPQPFCPVCGHKMGQPREIQQVAGELVQITDVPSKRQELNELLGKAKTYSDLAQIAKDRGYKPGWVDFQWRRKQMLYARKK